MVEVLTAVAIVVNLIRPPQPYPQQPYHPQPVPNVQTQIPNQGYYPNQYQTTVPPTNWSQAGSQPYGYGQQAQTPTNSLWR